jgi:hypothetical protein
LISTVSYILIFFMKLALTLIRNVDFLTQRKIC